MTARQLFTTVVVAVAALACVPALNGLGGALASAADFARGGSARLAWDLGWLLLSVFLTVWLPARWSPCWPRALAIVLAGLLMAVAAWAVWNVGADFPVWFVTSAIAGVPLAAAVGLVAARRRRGQRINAAPPSGNPPARPARR